MKKKADNKSMKAFSDVYKILSFVEENLDNDEFDVGKFNAEYFRMSENRFYNYVSMLIDGGYISGVELDAFIDGAPKFDDTAITMKGLEFLAEKSVLAKLSDGAKIVVESATGALLKYGLEKLA